MFRSSPSRLLRKLYEKVRLSSVSNHVHPRDFNEHAVTSRYLSDLASSNHRVSYAERFPPLFNSVPGLKLPPPLPDLHERNVTKITTLANGVRIASEDGPGPAACVGVFVDSGSMYETKETCGVTHLLERLAFKDTKSRSLQQIVQDLEATGGNAGAAASREQMAYSYDTLKAFLPQAVELLVDCIRNPIFLEKTVHDQLALVLEESREASNDPQKFLLEAVHTTGYSGALGNPVIAPEDALGRINRSLIEKFYFENYTGDRMVLAASGVDHQHLLDIAEPLLNDLPKGPTVEVPKSTYVGGDFRHKADSELTHVVLAFEVPGGWNQIKDATVLTVIQTLMGGGGSFSTGGPGKGLHSRLYLRVLNKHNPVQSFTAFSSIYNDTGLFGIQLSAGPDFVANAVDLAASELLTIATPGEVSALELHRAKNSTKSAILLNLESRAIVAEDIGRQILTYGCRKDIDYFLKCIDEMTLGDVAMMVQKLISSPLTMASYGDVDAVPTFEYVSQQLRT